MKTGLLCTMCAQSHYLHECSGIKGLQYHVFVYLAQSWILPAVPATSVHLQLHDGYLTCQFHVHTQYPSLPVGNSTGRQLIPFENPPNPLC